MKRNELQPFDNGLALLKCKLTAGTILNEFSVIENGALLRSLLQSFVLTVNLRQTNCTTVKNENLGRYLRSTVELTSQYRLKNGQTLPLRLQATLMNDPNYLSEMIKGSSVRPPDTQQEEPPELSLGILMIGTVENLLEHLEYLGNDN